jgi:hypothetical protein
MLSIRLYEPILYSTTFLEDISLEAVASWRRSTRRQGGYWRGSFILTGDQSRLAKFFYERLACHLVERWNGMVTWEGMIYEMDLTINGVTRRRSLDTFANWVYAIYIDPDNGESNNTTAVQNANSIRWFGRREEVLTLDGFDSDSADAYDDTYLKENAWPTARPVGFMPGQENQLVVTVCGYVFTANWRHEHSASTTKGNLSDYLTDLVTDNCEFLQTGRIASNTVQVNTGAMTPTRSFDIISDLCDLGDADGNPYRFYVDNDRRANYQQISITPEYYLRGGKLYASAGGSQEIAPWVVKPNVMRDMSYPVSRWNYAGWLNDARDIYVDEIEAGPGGLVIKTDLFEESELFAAQAAYQNSLQVIAPLGSDGGGGGGRHVWQHLGYTREQRLAMTPEEWQAIKRAAQKRKRETGRFV